jgi:hypothetical protein
MAAINLTSKQLDNAAAKMTKIFEKSVDTNKTTYVYDGEVKKFKGTGAAAVKKFWKATQLYAGKGEAASLVSMKSVKNRIKTAITTLKKVAKTKGNEDGKLQGTKAELGSVESKSAQALARFAHAIKK